MLDPRLLGSGYRATDEDRPECPSSVDLHRDVSMTTAEEPGGGSSPVPVGHNDLGTEHAGMPPVDPHRDVSMTTAEAP